MSLTYVTLCPFLVYYLILFCIAMHPMAGYATKGPLMDRVEYPQACHAALLRAPPWIGRLSHQDSDRQMRTSVEPTHWQLELAQADMEMAADERERALSDICCLVRRHEIRLRELISHLLQDGDGSQRSSTVEKSDSINTKASPVEDIHCSLLAHVAFASKILRIPENRTMAEAINDH